MNPVASSSPQSAELLENGHVLIAGQGNSQAVEVGRGDPADEILRTFTAGNSVAIVFASRLPNGHTLLTGPAMRGSMKWTTTAWSRISPACPQRRRRSPLPPL